MSEELNQPAQSETPTPEKPKKTRHGNAGKRKGKFRMDTPPYPVRAIWEMASPDEKQKAHEMGVLLLEHWLGHMTRKELGEKIGQPPLRIWQMSQQALAGMVVGLLNQPKKPPKGTPLTSTPPQENVKDLQKQLAEAQRQMQMQSELIGILRDLPANRQESRNSQTGGQQGRTKGKKNQDSQLSNPFTTQRRKMAQSSDASEG